MPPLSPITPPSPRALADRLPAWGLLLAGALASVAIGPRYTIAGLPWVALVPYLLYARRARSWRAWAALAGTAIVSASLGVVPIATPPVPLLGVIGFGPPVGLIWFASIAVAEALRRRTGETTGIFAFAAMIAVTSWVGYGATELGAWMALANTQVEHLAVLQLAAFGGLAGLGFVMAWFAGVVANLVGAPAGARRLRPAAALAGVLVVGLGWSTLRLDAAITGRHVTVAAVTTDVGMTAAGLPDAAALAANTERLFARTRLAAARGARLVVWNEVATVVMPEAEPAFVARATALARELGIDLVLGYAVLAGAEPLLLDNKYVFITDAGVVADTYQKHHPVPGEPSIRGTGALRVLDRPYGRVGGAICYDYDFPAMAREHARAGAELVVVPSSDWRGIDPVHTFMARVRAIEGGFSLLRSTRWGASGAFDAHGRIRGWMTAAEPDGVMIATLPIGRQPTLYATVGELPVALAALYLAVTLGVVIVRRRRRS